MKQYMSAPLPFVGQKRMLAREFKRALEQYHGSTVFVDLFGGSGLLSHIAKSQRPDATVVYNDYDNYRARLGNIPHTNRLLADIRGIVGDIQRHKIIAGDRRGAVFERIRQEEECHGYVDYITLTASLLFSMKYALCFEEMQKETLYNNIRMSDYPIATGYLDGLTITSEDYKSVFARYKDVPGVVFIIDPPYMSTDVSTYSMSWNITDYMDVLQVLNGHSFIYFTSNKTSLIELCEWMGRNKDIGNPFEGCDRAEFNARVNYSSTYTDIMLYKDAG